VPVSFAEISRVTALCEVIEMREGLVPDVSLGTHFFNDLVEMQIIYLAVFPDSAGNSLSTALLEQAPNRLPELLPDETRWAEVVRVIDPGAMAGRRTLHLHADALHQTAICYFEPPPKP
jgi:pyruvate,water dikinase